MESRDTMSDIRLRPPVFHILLSLSDRDLHGLGITDEVEETTGGSIQLGPGTLYRSLKLMAEDGFIQEVARPGLDDDPRRKYYRITEMGRAALRAEVAHLQAIVQVAHRKSVVPGAAS